ncbi:C1QL [Mytilus edulis]|uniref:C1QL n=1 Tax=Mytilus edulis TaxID=6550 RepID=A0A8S3S3A2_MYTED|nr:C1QL [Mytilus edulis]
MHVEFEEIRRHQTTQDKRIHELELTIQNQNKQIRNLERRCNYEEKDEVYKFFEEGSQTIKPNFESEQLEVIHRDGQMSLTGRRNTVHNEPPHRDNYRKRRRLNTDPVNTVAFYAYMSTHEANPGRHQTLIFDDVRTNLGSSYSKHTGVFSTTEHGTYVFTWTITSDINSYIFSEIVINSVPFGSIVTESEEVRDDHSATGIVVAELNHGDVVYIRTNPNASIKGKILSDSLRRSSFSGWKIM